MNRKILANPQHKCWGNGMSGRSWDSVHLYERVPLRPQGQSFPVLNEEGQAFTEYILLISAVVSFYVMIAAGLSKIGLGKKLAAPLNTTFASAYRYGHPMAKGFDDGGPKNHPRIYTSGDNNFRLFYNPSAK